MVTERQPGASQTPSFDEMVDNGSSNLFKRIIDGTVGNVLDKVDSGLVYGQPVTQGERTVITVSRVKMMYGFGGGSGYGVDTSEGNGDSGGGSGGGGGGNVNARPVGYIELTPASTQFVAIVDRNALLRIGAIFAGIVTVLMVAGALRRG